MESTELRSTDQFKHNWHSTIFLNDIICVIYIFVLHTYHPAKHSKYMYMSLRLSEDGRLSRPSREG